MQVNPARFGWIALNTLLAQYSDVKFLRDGKRLTGKQAPDEGERVLIRPLHRRRLERIYADALLAASR
jgi:hypothetical protein